MNHFDPDTAAFRVDSHLTLVPVLHESADWTMALKNFFFKKDYDALAVSLPKSFKSEVEASIELLPQISLVIQRESKEYQEVWNSQQDEDGVNDERSSYVPIDPCQAIIALLRVALQERIPRYFVDLETAYFVPWHPISPDPYALKNVSMGAFAAALMPALPPLPLGQERSRAIYMAQKLKNLTTRHRQVFALCSFELWPWVRKFYLQKPSQLPSDEEVMPAESYSPLAKTLIFILGELPFVTSLYERARFELGDESHLSVDGVKELLIETREHYTQDLGKRAQRITPQKLSTYLKYVRNLSLIERRLTPDLYSLVMAAQQIMGEQFAVHLTKVAREYSFGVVPGYQTVTLGVDRVRFFDGETRKLVSRLPGSQRQWRSLNLKPLPDKKLRKLWQINWNSFAQCSWPAEDQIIENFRHSVMDRARAIMGQDLAQSEKFTTSLRDGLDMRETLRHWHAGDIYVKVLPPARGNLDAVVMLFDTPADPRDYPWRTTWLAEHDQESTLAFYATDFSREIVGPGIGLATYGGAFFLFPPRSIVDIWQDPRFDFTLTLEERLLAGACYYSESPQVALLASRQPSSSWQQIAKRYHKKLVHVPLGQFGESTVAQLRLVHVLQGKEVRSFAAHFIRKV